MMFPFVLFFSVCIYTIKDEDKKETLHGKKIIFSVLNLFCFAALLSRIRRAMLLLRRVLCDG